MSTTSKVPASVTLSPTTGEPVAVVARRNRMGVWLLVVSDITGTVALLIAYSYLWSLNVNGGWAPPKNAWAAHGPFWGILGGFVLATLVMWWGVRGIRAGHHGRLVLAAAVSSLLVVACFAAQIWQLSTFPFGPADGAYASATYWLAFANVLHLSIVGFLVLAVSNRTRLGLITTTNHSHASLVAMWMTWVCIACFLGAVVTTTMEISPNTNPATFGEFKG